MYDLIAKETGEVVFSDIDPEKYLLVNKSIPSWVQGEDVHNFLNQKGRAIHLSSIRSEVATKQKKPDIETELGKLFTFSARSFSKFFSSKLDRPKFSQSSFYECWCKILPRLEQNTNLICNDNQERITSKSQLQQICEVTKPTFISFLSECYEKRYLAEFKKKDCNVIYFAMNPKYGQNGNALPEGILKLFYPKCKIKSGIITRKTLK